MGLIQQTRTIRIPTAGPNAILNRSVAVATFNRNGAVAADERSDPLPVHRPGRLALWYCRLAVVGPTDSVFELELNGTVVATTTVPANSFVSAVNEITDGPVLVPFTDYLTAHCATAAAGIEGFVGLAVLV